MLELFHHKTAVCAQKVRLVLEEKGLEWTGHELDLRAGDQLDPDYLKLNPNGVVPTLVHDGAPVIESTLINEYLDDICQAPALRPAEPRARAQMRLWTKAVDEGLHYAIGALSFAVLQRDAWLAKPKEELDAHLARLPDPARRTRQRQAIELGLEAPMVTGAIESYAKATARMESALADRDWLVGDDYTLADVALTPYLSRLSMLGMGGLWGRNVSAWLDRIIQRPNYDRAIIAFFPAAERERFAALGGEAWKSLKTIASAP